MARSLWQQQAPFEQHPHLEGELAADVCIVGAGITGAACAWRLLEHGLSVVLLDAREAAASASGRNGGFATTGTALEYPELAARLGARSAARLHHSTETALQAMMDRAAELGVVDTVRRTGSLWLAGQAEAAAVRETLKLCQATGIRCEPAGDRIPARLRRHFETGAYFPLDAELLPARFVRALVAGLGHRGALVRERSPVRELVAEGRGWRARSTDGSVAADAVVVACDGLVPRLAPETTGLIYPVRGQVAATEVLPAHQRILECPTHSMFGFMYYRPTPDGRITVGGGRLADLEAEYTEHEKTTPAVQHAIDRFATEVLGLEGVHMTHRWAGIMGFSADLLPLAGELPERPGLYVCGGYSGVGNVQGYHCGGLVADLIGVGHHPDAAVYDPNRFGPGAPHQALEKDRSRALLAASA